MRGMIDKTGRSLLVWVVVGLLVKLRRTNRKSWSNRLRDPEFGQGRWISTKIQGPQVPVGAVLAWL